MTELHSVTANTLKSENHLRVFWNYRSFIWSSALHDLRHRYAGSTVGVFWNVLIPLAQILIYTVVFSRIMSGRLPGNESTSGFAIYLCSGLLPFLAFSDCVTRGTHSFVENSTYLKKLPIPEQVFVAKNALAATLSLAISMTLLFLATAFLGGEISLTWLAVPPAIVMMQTLGFGLGLALGCLNVFFRDVGQMLGIGMQMWMWLTPIVYVKGVLPDLLQRLMVLNPLFPFVDSMQRAVVLGTWPEPGSWGLMLIWSLLAPIAGYAILSALRPEIRDVI